MSKNPYPIFQMGNLPAKVMPSFIENVKEVLQKCYICKIPIGSKKETVTVSYHTDCLEREIMGLIDVVESDEIIERLYKRLKKIKNIKGKLPSERR